MKLRLIVAGAGVILAASGLLTGCKSPNTTSAEVAAAGPQQVGVPGLNNPMVGGAAMSPTNNIIDNAVNSKDHTTLIAAVRAAGLEDTLRGPGPFTVFAPTNAAFDLLPPGTVDTLMKPANKAKLVKVLTYHVVPGRLNAAMIDKMILDGGGKAVLTTVEGEPLIATNPGSRIRLTDTKGGEATVSIADVYQSNGIIHVVDRVLLP